MTKTFVVPKELKDLPQWVGVKLIPDDDRPGKMKKIPVNPKTLKHLSGAWHEKLGWKFSEVKTPIKGFALRGGDNISILDFDFANMPDHPSYAFAQKIIEELHSFTEISASGAGLHIIVQGSIPRHIYEKETLGLEVYSEKRFFAITGNQYNGFSPVLADGQKVLDRLFKKYGEKEPEPTPDFNGHRKTFKSDPQLEDLVIGYVDVLADHRADDREEWLEILFCLHAYYEGSEKGLELADKFSRRCPVKYSRRAVESAWRSAQKFGGKAVGFSRLEQRVMEDHPSMFPPLPSEKKKKEDPGPSAGPEPTPDPGPTSEPAAETTTEEQERIFEEARRARLAAVVEASQSRFQLHTYAEATVPQPPVDWIVDGLMATRTTNVVYGDPGSYKTYIELVKAVCIAAGRPFLDMPVKQGPVLIIDEESGHVRLLRRLREVALGLGNIPDDLPLYFISLAGVLLGAKSMDDKAIIESIVQQVSPVFCIIDALADVTDGDENSKEYIQPVFQFLRKLAEDYGTAFDMIHHPNKAGGYRGSSAMLGAIDSQMKIVLHDDEIYFKMEKSRDAALITFGAKVTMFVNGDGENTFSLEPTAIDASKVERTSNRSKKTTSKDMLVLLLFDHPDISLAEVLTEIPSQSEGSIKMALGRLVQDGYVLKKDYKNKPPTYKLSVKGEALMEDNSL